MKEQYDYQAVKSSENPSFTHWTWGPFRVTTYPDSELIYIARSNKTYQRLRGHIIEDAAKSAIRKAKTVSATFDNEDAG